MKKNIKKIICYTLIILSVANVFGGRKIMAATNKPNSDWSLKTVKKGGNGKYEGYGTCNTVDLYSAYYFKGVSKMKISVTNVSSKKV